jgi:hypothetical protein
MEHFGSHYAVILNDPKLRAAAVAEAEQSQLSVEKMRASLRLRFRLAGVLRALAIRVEPRRAHSSEPGTPQPVFAE